MNISRDVSRCHSQPVINAAGGKRRKSQTQNKIEYLPDAKIGDVFFNIIPNEIWLHVFKISGTSDRKYIETCKSWQYIVEKDYELTNGDKNYLSWDSSLLYRKLSPKLIYFSNRIFYELIMRHRDLVLSSTIRQKMPEEKFDKICSSIIDDSLLLKRDHIFKSVARLLKNHKYNSFKVLKKIDNEQNSLLIKIKSLIHSENSNQNYKILYNYVLNIKPDRAREFYTNFSEKYQFLNVIKNTDVLKDLINIKDKTAVQFRKIVELKEWPFPQDLKMAAIHTHKEEQNFIDAVGYWLKYSNNNLEMTCSELKDEISPAFFKAGKLKELATLCTHFNKMHFYKKVENLPILIDLCRQAEQFEEAANFGKEILSNEQMHPSTDEQKKIAQDCFKASMFNDAANISINIINVTKPPTDEEIMMLIEALKQAGRFGEVAIYRQQFSKNLT